MPFGQRLADPYRILGVSRIAGPDELRRAYHDLALKHHPDANPSPDSEKKFKEIAEAYRILSDPELKKRYDAYTLFTLGLPVDRWVRSARFNAGAASGIYRRLAEILNPAKKPPRGDDLARRVDISLGDSMTGVAVRIDYVRSVRCKCCRGTGFDELISCKACKGAGSVFASRTFGISKRCPRCNGTGLLGKGRCRSCGGAGRLAANESVSVPLNPGASDGDRIRVKGKGDEPFGPEESFEAGDLVVIIRVGRRDGFHREGDDLMGKITVPFVAAIHGGVLDVRLPDDSVLKLRIPGKTWQGRKFRISGRGFTDSKSGRRGDLFLIADIEAPKLTDPKASALAAEYLRSVRSENHKMPDGLAEFFKRPACG